MPHRVETQSRKLLIAQTMNAMDFTGLIKQPEPQTDVDAEYVLTELVVQLSVLLAIIQAAVDECEEFSN